MSFLFVFGLVILATVLGAVGALLLKKSSRGTLKQLFTHPELYGGGLLYAVSSLFFVYALRFAELSVLYPATALSYIWIALLSRRYLQEKIHPATMLGMGCIIIGIVLIAAGL